MLFCLCNILTLRTWFSFLGEDVPVGEQVNKEDKKRHDLHDVLEQQKPSAPQTVVASNTEIESFNEERNKLYKQIDERVSC